MWQAINKCVLDHPVLARIAFAAFLAAVIGGLAWRAIARHGAKAVGPVAVILTVTALSFVFDRFKKGNAAH